jgi:RNA polymerase sigma-70 factor (ECF subfamily)
VLAPTGGLARHGYVNEAEADLIQECIAGDHRAWEALIRRYQHRVYNVAYHMTQDAERANDLSQEAFLQVLRSLPRFRGEASLSTWIHGLTMRVCLHHLRKERRRQADSWEELAPGRPEPAGRDGRPEEEVVRDQVQRQVHEAIRQLPLKFRSVMVLHGLGGMTYEETAQALHIPVNTVKTRVFRAKARLREALRHLVGDDPDGV